MLALKRIGGDIRTLSKSIDNNVTFSFWNDPNDITKFDIMIYGPKGSYCFDDCFLYFKVDCSKNYPVQPPLFNFVNSIGVRFHPNLYVEGKVCLTILNTWRDTKVQGWSAGTSIEAIIHTIRSILNDNPLAEEPGQNHKLTDKRAKDYQIAAKYSTLSNTFAYFLKDYKFNDEFWKQMCCQFMKFRSTYIESINELQKYENTTITYFHGIVFINIINLKKQLQQVENKIATYKYEFDCESISTIIYGDILDKSGHICPKFSDAWAQEPKFSSVKADGKSINLLDNSMTCSELSNKFCAEKVSIKDTLTKQKKNSKKTKQKSDSSSSSSDSEEKPRKNKMVKKKTKNKSSSEDSD